MSTMQRALARCNGMIESAEERALTLKASGLLDFSPPSGVGQFNQFKNQAANKERYALFRGWLYSAVNALASESAGQPCTVAKLKGKSEKPKKEKGLRNRMTSTARQKTADREFEVLLDHPLIDLLEEPNPIQRRWQFVYSFVANLNLTGWSYVIGGENEKGKYEFYSLPTTWIRADHKEGPFSRFKVVDPTNPTAGGDDDWLTRENVAFAMLPNPADPRMAMPPAQSQIQAIRIDDFIQSSQEQFFDNGIFPGAIITIGKNPHPDVPGGVRPRLTAAQRRQVTAAVRKVMGGVANYGNPAIVDGLIESVERLSMSSNEMGWEKAEDKIRTRILSAFGVHPYILGEPVGVGGYAQVANIEKRFYKRVNTFLDMLGAVISDFVVPASGGAENILAWWDEAVPHDPSLRWSNLNAARNRGDVSRNEIRSELGLPADETGGDHNRAFSAGDVNALVAIQGKVASAEITPEQARAIYEVAFDLDPKEAKRIAGKAPPKPPEGEGAPGTEPKPETEPPTEEEAVEEAAEALEKAVASLGLSVVDGGLSKRIAERLVEITE